MGKRKLSSIDSTSSQATASKKLNEYNGGSTSKIGTNTLTELFICPITHGLMVDPVTAEDGYTYERTAIEKWLQRKTYSPLIPTKRIEVKNLNVARTVKQTIQTLVESGAIDGMDSDDWKEKKRELDMLEAQKLFEEGSYMDAAKMGSPRAQGVIALSYYYGINKMEQNYNKCYEWAKKAADGNDIHGQFHLALLYEKGQMVERDLSKAISWHEKSANQGYSLSMYNLGVLYETGGYKLDHDFIRKAANWYEKAANKGDYDAMVEIGKYYYKGEGVKKSFKVAREWFEKASIGREHNNEADFWLGKMMMRGEGGGKDRVKGFSLIERSASKGYSLADIKIEAFSGMLA